MSAEFEVIDSRALPELDGYAAPFTKAVGRVRSRYYAPAEFGQFVAHGTLDRGAELAWASSHGDEALFVLEGEVRVDGQPVGLKEAVVIESDVAAVLEVTADARFVHVGSTEPGPNNESVFGPPDTTKRSVHVHTPATSPVVRHELGTVEVDGVVHDDIVNTAWFADGRCPSCRVALFRVWGDGPHRGASHHHSAHELITVTAGQIQVGRDRIEPGMTLAIPAERRYSFRASGRWEFLNYRSDISSITRNPADPPVFDGP
jgi:quercetin dioxygenase-like cupin family protein